MTVKSTHLQPLINNFVDTGCHSDAWSAFAEKMVKTYQLHVCHVVIVNKETMALRFHVDAGERMDPDIANEYLSTHIHGDRLLQTVLSHPTGCFYSINSHPERDDIVQSEHYQTWAVPQGLLDSAAACILSEGPWLGVVFFNRHESQGVFSAEELEDFNTLLPVMEKAAVRSFAVRPENLAEMRLSSVVDTFRIPVAILTETGEVCAINQGMKKLLQDVPEIRIEGGCIRLQSQEREKLLYVGLMQTAKRVEGFDLNLDEAEQLQISQQVFIGFQPLQNTFVIGENRFSGAMIYAVSPELIDPIPAEKLALLFGLTDKEAQICQKLARGLAPKAVAEEVFVSMNTVKFHLKNIFAKTGCSSQMALVNMLNSIPFSH